MSSVHFAKQPFPLLDKTLITQLKKDALKADLGRSRICLHQNHDDPIQEMVIVHTSRSLDRPHRHEGKSISIMVLEGVLYIPIFDDKGKVINCFELSTSDSEKPFLIRLSLGEWYACVPKTDPVVIFESLGGPFKKGANFYPEWAPEDRVELAEFLRRSIEIQNVT
ncbi:MAG: cupin fold metalloprotein, WbuC family [Magnetococcales bacterium]|nr:cupin fold metalloprotein, WbuC family [Magnetococcales bacterium]